MTWFRPMGLLFRPASLAGWLISLAVIGFCIQAFIAVDRHSHSGSDTLYGIFPFWAPAFLLLAWIADRTGGRRKVG